MSNMGNNELMVFIDKAPMIVSYLTSVHVLLEMFIKLGVKYICVLDHQHHFIGIVNKKNLITRLNKMKED